MTDHDPRRVRLERVQREYDDDRSGMVLVWLAAAFAILLGIVIAVAILATSRGGQDPGPQHGTGLTGPDLREAPYGEGSVASPDGDTSPTIGMRPASVGAVAAASPPATTSGWATWYDDGPGFYGAVNSWRWGDDPYAVQVCLADRPGTCTHVVIRDFCACGDRHGEATVIDLSPSAFRELAPLSRGVIRVTVSGRIDIPLPPTDMEGAP